LVWYRYQFGIDVKLVVLCGGIGGMRCVCFYMLSEISLPKLAGAVSERTEHVARGEAQGE
jgi:hypothetical protein